MPRQPSAWAWRPSIPAMTSLPMIDEDGEQERDRKVDEIVNRGPAGAFALAGIATAIVVVLYFAFYFLVYLPRGAVQ